MPHRARRPLALLPLLVVFALMLLPGGVPAPTPAAAQPDESRLATIQAGYDLLMDQFYRVPDPAALLNAGWTGAVRSVTRAGYEGEPPPRPQFPADREGAWQAFAAAYPGLAALAPVRLSQVEIAFAALDDMADSLNEGHTAFLPPESYRNFVEDLGGETTGNGIGIVVGQQRPWVITESYLAAPGDRAGLRSGDAIVAVDGRDVTAVTRAELTDALRGPDGTNVVITVERAGLRAEFTVTRGEFVLPDVAARVLPDGTGVLRLRSFSAFIRPPSGRPNAIEMLDLALERFEEAGVQRWVVDLRDNSGGYTFTASALLGRFLPDAIVAQISTERDIFARGRVIGRPFRVQRPLAVLVNRRSASSSEIFAGTMQEYGRAVLVGTRTAGILAGAIPYPLPDGAGLYIAVEEVRTGRRGAIVDEVGIIPDIEVADNRRADADIFGQDAQLAAAIDALRGRPVGEMPSVPAVESTSPAVLEALLGPVFPDPSQVPPTDLIDEPRWLGDLPLTEPSEWVAWGGQTADPEAVIAAVRERGWQGGYARFYGEVSGLGGPFIGVQVDLYADAGGAIRALNSNDFPLVLAETPVPAQLGDGAVAYRGVWELAGVNVLMWRAGRAVITVSYSAAPGRESFAPVLTVATTVDARLRQTPIEVTR